MRVLAMIPARLGSVRVVRKNLREIGPGLSLLGCAVCRCADADCFDVVWVDTHETELVDEARRYGAAVHVRPKELTGEGQDTAFKVEFLQGHPSDWCVIVNPTAPLVKPETLRRFVDALDAVDADVVHTVERLSGSMVCRGAPVNFHRDRHPDTKTNEPVWHLLWAMTALASAAFLSAGSHSVYPEGRTALYELSWPETVDIDTEADLDYARFLYGRGIRGS